MDTKGNSERYSIGEQNVKYFREGRGVAIRVGLRDYLAGPEEDDERIEVEDRIEVYINLAKARRGDYEAREELIAFAKNDAKLLDYIGKALAASGEVPIEGDPVSCAEESRDRG